jgi:hypothetical protein
MSDPALLSRTAARLRDVAGFIAFELDRYRKLTTIDAAHDFGFPTGSVAQLALCRLPRPDAYAADVTAIGARVGVPAAAVANFLHAVDAVAALASRDGFVAAAQPDRAGMLTAARDHAEEHTGFEEPATGRPTVPGWLGHAVDRLWGQEEPPATFPRDLHLPILLSLPVAIIEIDGLTVASLDHWLQRHRLPRFASVADRPLRGCLTAYAGVGILFVDRSDDADQRRLTLAHEVGHFIVDYLLPREDVARRRPELLAVLDGDRAPTDAERFDALLADVPFGFHTHLLERDAHGGHLSNATADLEDRAERLALELLAPLESVLVALRDGASSSASDTQSLLRDRFGLPAGVATRYADHVQRFRPRPPRSLSDAIGLTKPSEIPPGTEPDDDEEPKR